jgi:hypothetical protein
MAHVSNGVDTTDLVAAIQDCIKANVIEAKLPRYAESRRIDAVRDTRIAWARVMREINALTAACE